MCDNGKSRQEHREASGRRKAFPNLGTSSRRADRNALSCDHVSVPLLTFYCVPQSRVRRPLRLHA